MSTLFENNEPLLIDSKSKHYIWTHDLNVKPSDEDETGLTLIEVQNANLVPALGKGKWDGHIFISGATGAGKSTMIRNIVENDAKKRDRILFTNNKHKDPAFEGMKYIQFDKNDPIHNTNWLNENLEDKILIFDDILGNEDYEWMRDKMLEEGRKHGITVICVNHKTRDHQKTKHALVDCRYLITFPNANSGPSAALLKDEMALNPKQVRAILNQIKNEGRQMVVHRFSPNFVSGASSIFKP